MRTQARLQKLIRLQTGRQEGRLRWSLPRDKTPLCVLRKSPVREYGSHNRKGDSYMVETTALSPALGVEVTGASDLLDNALISRCLEASTTAPTRCAGQGHHAERQPRGESRRRHRVRQHLRHLREPART